MFVNSFLNEHVKITKIADHTTAGTTAVTSAAVDMAGYQGALFLTSFGTAAANNTVKVQSSSDDGSSDAYADLTGTSVSAGTSDEDIWVDIVNPPERYLKLVSARGTSTTQESVWVIQYRARAVAVDNTTSGTITGEAHNMPAEGTA